MTQHTCTQEQFLKDIAGHEMTVIRSDGINRHLRFRKAGSIDQSFDLITWPGTLCIDGDMGTYVFRRLEDMFQFFRTDRAYGKSKGNPLFINPQYWAEKIQAAPKHKGVTEFDEDRFNEVIKEYFVNWIRDKRDKTTKDERRELWEAIEFNVLGADGDTGGYRKQCAAHDFSHKVNKNVHFHFQDFFETNTVAWQSFVATTAATPPSRWRRRGRRRSQGHCQIRSRLTTRARRSVHPR